jgi:SAM-dependent MidA family methyltransferase
MASNPSPATTPLQQKITSIIRADGPITFARYMDLCLYDPEHGYYMHSADSSRRDYYTSADLSPIFGRLIACQLFEMWQLCGEPAEFTIVEAGAGSGALAIAILDFLSSAQPAFYSALRYLTAEISPARRESQSDLLAKHMRARRFSAHPALPTQIHVGCILSNELLDALPVHRVVQRGSALKEIYVGLEGDSASRLIELEGGLSTPAMADYFRTGGITLESGQFAEAGLAAASWIESAGAALQRGFAITIDYGREARELYDQLHMRGTALAYFHHQASENFYAAPGEQDLTAHVNFTALDLAASRTGLHRTGLVSQTNFLLAITRRYAAALAPIFENSSDKENIRARLAFKSLLHPEGLGEAFSVLIHHKHLSAPHLSGLEPL